MDSIMAFSSIFKKATSLFGLGGDELKHPPLDGEIIYCKNNVCVHPPAPLVMDSEHHPGYLTIRSQNHNVSKHGIYFTKYNTYCHFFNIGNCVFEDDVFTG